MSKPVMSSRPIVSLLIVSLLIAVAFAGAEVAGAQDNVIEATPEPSPVATALEGGRDVPPRTVEDGGQPDTVNPGQVILDTGTILSGIIAIFVSGGVVGAGGLLVAVRAIRQNDPMKLAIERLYMSAPVTTQKPIRAGVELGKETFDLLDEVTDGKLPGQGTPTA